MRAPVSAAATPFHLPLEFPQVGQQLARRLVSTFNHDFRKQRPPLGSPCVAIPDAPDFGQSWHCIHVPAPPKGVTPTILIDLPTRERKDQDDRDVPHDQYELVPQRGESTTCLQWIFRVPAEVIPDHNEIFIPKARSLMLALIQISGAVASLARDWDDTFVP